MSEVEKRWLRITVIFAIVIATMTVIALVMFSGAISATPFQVGSLTAMANATAWNTATSLFNVASLTEILATVALIVITILGVLGLFLLFTARLAGLNE